MSAAQFSGSETPAGRAVDAGRGPRIGAALSDRPGAFAAGFAGALGGRV
ncbi:hypothetical protein BSIN_1927 [Burkholderia singularis]|uniref:Uncharacterized protein n=1 Tax=Burkholderia singularis TaxID=1503053 RepID=A0A238H0B1_9BURK|nr:hypothetical protein BSIN_1927 [Burkholderia singularis]